MKSDSPHAAHAVVEGRDPDVTELHKPENPAVARSAAARDDVADFSPGASYPLAANGGRRLNQKAMGTSPQIKPGFRPIKKKTHSGKTRTGHHGKWHRRNRHAHKTCVDKTRYANSAAAHQAINGIIRQPGKKKFSSLHAYKCACGGWHITRT